MKVYSIGREVGCDIVINDNTDVISRRHAILNVMPSGKMTIVDQSHNGTYVNGIRISPNVPFPVTRKDNISFAHVARLDWNIVPKPVSPLKYVAIAIATLVIIGGGIFGYRYFFSEPSPETVTVDSTKIKQKTEEEIRIALEDSLKREQEKKDSIAKAKRDSVAKANAKRDSVAKGKKTVQDKGSKSEPKKQEEKKKSFR